MTYQPLSDQIRPTQFSDMIGQEHLVGPQGVLTNMLTKNRLQSVIFYGPPGTGKTTTARIIAENSNLPFCSLNATNASITDIKKIADKESSTFLLYLDEIQYFNKKQQQSLLPLIENGSCVLIAATTENPYYALYDALLSRCIVCEFKPVDIEQIAQHLQSIQAQTFDDDAIQVIAQLSAGDVRRAINLYELATQQYPNQTITKDDIKHLTPTASMSGFDLNGDIHYGLLSGLQKSIRGSDPDAAIFYLARLLQGGDILSPCRRLLVIASEDIGLAHNAAAGWVYNLTQSAKQLGLPEAFYPLAHATLLLALSPKSSTIGGAYTQAVADIKAGYGATIPYYIQDAHHPDYKFPHDYPNHWVAQDYLPSDLKGRIYYQVGDNAFEESLARYWNQIKELTP